MLMPLLAAMKALSRLNLALSALLPSRMRLAKRKVFPLASRCAAVSMAGLGSKPHLGGRLSEYQYLRMSWATLSLLRAVLREEEVRKA